MTVHGLPNVWFTHNCIVVFQRSATVVGSLLFAANKYVHIKSNQNRLMNDDLDPSSSIT